MAQTTNLSEGGAEAFRALLTSVAPGADENLSPEAIQRLAEKFTSLVGGQADAQGIMNAQQGGELNEEGLPIIDINEQVTEESLPIEEADVKPLAALSPGELEARRRERERILDLLEAEEEEMERKERETAAQQRKTALETRRELERKEADRLAAHKAMQKKMGKALLKGIQSDPPKAQSSPAPPPPPPVGPKKSVAFAGEANVPGIKSTMASAEWGDISPARLSSQATRPALISQLKTDETLPMKMDVVERVPAAPKSPSLTPQAYVDSDDESEPPASDEDEDEEPLSDDDLEDGTDMDYAHHQREIAMEYHRRKATIGQDVAQTMKSHSHDEDIPIPPTRASLSRFKSERLASSYNTLSPGSSQSLGSAAVLPASGAETIRNAIKMGKLEEDRLVAAEGSDGSDGELQEVLELIKKGEVYNAGPYGYAVPVTPAEKKDSTAPSTSKLGVIPPLPAKPKTSKFKASRPPGSRPPQTPISESTTPVNSTGRSSPKEPFRQLPPGFDASVVPIGDPMSMIVESPSFPVQKTQQSKASNVMSPTVRERERESSRPSKPPMVMSAGVKERLVSSAQVGIAGSTEVPPAKVSRFKLARTQ